MPSDEYQAICWTTETRLVSAIDGRSIRAQRLKVLLGRIGRSLSCAVSFPQIQQAGSTAFARFRAEVYSNLLFFISPFQKESIHSVPETRFVQLQINSHIILNVFLWVEISICIRAFDVWSMLTSCYWHIGVWVIRLCEPRACTNADSPPHIAATVTYALTRPCPPVCPTQWSLKLHTLALAYMSFWTLWILLNWRARILHFGWIGISWDILLQQLL